MRLLDIQGERFGESVVGQCVGRSSDGKALWEVKCGCGKTFRSTATRLRRGRASCGCIRDEVTRRRSLKHGHTVGRESSPEHKAWQGMKTRCASKKGSPAWKHYGARDIRVCPQWLDSFETFFKDMGPKPSPLHSLDRIDGDKGYEPGNVRWATRKTQNLNRRHPREAEMTPCSHCGGSGFTSIPP
jgi:hypothetical protein